MNNSYQWLDIILEKLFAPEERRIEKMVANLNAQNGKLKNKQLLGFMHLGELYVPEDCKQLFRVQHGRRNNGSMNEPVPTLDLRLSAEASQFTSDVNKVKADKDRIKQVLYKLIHQANSKQELRDALPECVVELIPELKAMDRFIQDPAFMIRSDWRAVKEYQKTLPKIEFYAMTALIY